MTAFSVFEEFTEAEKRRLQEGVMHPRLRDRALWLRYYRSQYWDNIRTQKLSKTPSCEVCGSTDGLQIHHANGYRRFFDEDLDSLRVLCDGCHREVHERRKQRLPF